MYAVLLLRALHVVRLVDLVVRKDALVGQLDSAIADALHLLSVQVARAKQRVCSGVCSLVEPVSGARLLRSLLLLVCAARATTAALARL